MYNPNLTGTLIHRADEPRKLSLNVNGGGIYRALVPQYMAGRHPPGHWVWFNHGEEAVALSINKTPMSIHVVQSCICSVDPIICIYEILVLLVEIEH